MNKEGKKEKSAPKKAIGAFKKSLLLMSDSTLVETIAPIAEGMCNRTPENEIRHRAEALLRNPRINSATRNAYLTLARNTEAQALAFPNSPLLKLARQVIKQCEV